MSPDAARRRYDTWSQQLGDHLVMRGLDTYAASDKLPFERRQHIKEVLFAAGLENITREKVGLPPLTDDEVVARVMKDYGPHKSVRERVGYRRVYR